MLKKDSYKWLTRFFLVCLAISQLIQTINTEKANASTQSSPKNNAKWVLSRGGRGGGSRGGGSRGGSSSSSSSGTKSGGSSSIGATGSGGSTGSSEPVDPVVIYAILFSILGFFLLIGIIVCVCFCVKKKQKQKYEKKVNKARKKIAKGKLVCLKKHPLDRFVQNFSEIQSIDIYRDKDHIKCDYCDRSNRIKSNFYRCSEDCNFDICSDCYETAKHKEADYETSDDSDNEFENEAHADEFESENNDIENQPIKTNGDARNYPDAESSDKEFNLKNPKNENPDVPLNNYNPYANNPNVPANGYNMYANNPNMPPNGYNTYANNPNMPPNGFTPFANNPNLPPNGQNPYGYNPNIRPNSNHPNIANNNNYNGENFGP